MSGNTPDEKTTDEELLDMLDNTLRNGSNPTRANLVFDLLCERLGFDRHQLPGYLADMAELEKEDARAREFFKDDTPLEETPEAPITEDERSWAATVLPNHHGGLRP